MTELCTVKKIKRGTVYVEISRTDKCDGCKVCAFNGKKSVVVPTVCGIAVAVGDSVEVEMPTRSAGIASLSIYALPLLFMVIGAAIGLLGDWRLQMSLAAAGLVIGLACAWFTDRLYRKKSGVLPSVLRIVTEDGETNDGCISSDGNKTKETQGDI